MKNEAIGPLTTSLPLTASRADQIFPTLTKDEVDRIAAHGLRRPTRAGEILAEQGDAAIPFFVIVSGELEAPQIRPATTSTLDQGVPVFVVKSRAA